MIATQSPVLTSLEAAQWLRYIEPDAQDADINKGVRRLHRLVQAGLLAPVGIKPYTFMLRELERYIQAATDANTCRTSTRNTTGDTPDATNPHAVTGNVTKP